MEIDQSKIHTVLRPAQENLKSKIGWLILAALIFIPRLLNLDVFLTADEPLFLEHARDFATGLTTSDFSQTLGIGYPGVTVAGWAAPVVGLSQSEMGTYVVGRVVTVLLTGLLLLVMYGLAKSLLGQWPAFIGLILLTLDPYTLAYSRLLHIAAPLALFMTLAALSLLLWLRDSKYRWVVLAGLFSGLALLTKSTALLLIPMLAVIILVWSLSNGLWRVLNWWLYTVVGLLVAAIVAVIIFFALWPAMWVDPVGALNLTFGKLFVDQEAGAGNLGLFWFGRFVEDPGPAFYPVAFLLKSTPWLLVGLALSLFYLFRTNAKPETPNPKPQTLSLWLFALIYLIIMTIASKKSIRYMMPVFPAFYLLAGMAYSQTLKRLKARKPLGFLFRSSSPLLPCSPAPLLLILSGLILFSLFYHPYYFTYYNPLLLGWRWAPQTLLVGWGEGLDEAARYLNNQPDSKVSAWYEWLFPILYQGEVQAVVPQENLITADHAVLYINQVQRDIPSPNIIHYFRNRRQPEHTVRLAGIDYAWVYSGPIAGFGSDPVPQYPLTGEFGGETRLLGYDLHPPQPVGGDSLIVTLYWRVLNPPPAERFVYLRLVDEQGHIWASADSPPVMGLWPTTRWQPDMLIGDAHELPIPAGTPPGNYRLEVGLYDPTTDTPQILPASGQPVGQGGGLLLGEVTVNWQSLRAQPDLPWLTNARLSPEVRLIGYSPPSPAATSGDLIPIQLAWREASSILRFGAVAENEIVFEWYQDGQAQAEQRASFPLPIDEWGRRATLLSQHDIVVPPTLETGSYDLNVSLYNDTQPAGESVWLGTVDVTAPSHQFNLPGDAISPSHLAQLTTESMQKVSLAGYNYKIADQGISLNLYWQPETAITTRYKVFAQLLAADNTLVAQSDTIPATGQRPTTGWLPGEIIADSHRLNFIPDLPEGNYHIIAGLYNPINGQRVPILNEAGETVADAIYVTEVILP